MGIFVYSILFNKYNIMVMNLKKSFLTAMVATVCLSVYGQQSARNAAPNDWHLKDRSEGYYGISLDKAYKFVKGKTGKTVIVAVIDSGIDTTHEDLKPVLWRNEKEIPGNGVDDDGNGYVDDVHGWNFLGGRDGRNVKEDSYEAARVYHNLKAKYEGVKPETLSPAEKAEYKVWLRAKKDAVGNVNVNEVAQLKLFLPGILRGDSIISKALGKEEYTGTEVKSYSGTDRDALMTKAIILNICENNNNNFDITNKQIVENMEGELRKGEAATQAPPNFRGDIVQDNENDINDRFYGNNDIMAGTSMHGTHVSGIIAGVRGNGKGNDGIADNVRIMTLRAVPDGDEHDKDIALAIRYAVDNGARIINMSFGKSFSPQKNWVDEAVQYAESKGVLLVHAAGNDARNLDTTYNYPSPEFTDSRRASNWLTVGASGDPKNGGLVANFSNYGKKEVDVFAPGVNIYSAVPGGNTYRSMSGTSMAAPVTSGVAAFLLSYYPSLTPQQVKQVIEKSTVAPGVRVTNPGSGQTVDLSELSRTGGVINAYEAARLAATLTGEKAPEPAPRKMKVKQPVKS